MRIKSKEPGQTRQGTRLDREQGKALVWRENKVRYQVRQRIRQGTRLESEVKLINLISLDNPIRLVSSPQLILTTNESKK